MNEARHHCLQERILAGAGIALLALAIAGPHVGAPPGYQDFVDTRVWHGIPNAGDVLSNFGFLAAGLAGLVSLRKRSMLLTNMQRAMAVLFFAGLALTSFCSGWYHLGPDDARLVIDRSGMAITFAGLLGFAASAKVSERAAACVALAVLLAAPWATGAAMRGELLPWAVLQFGGMAFLAAMAAMRSIRDAPQVNWLAVIAIYAAAKLCESADASIFEATRHFISGHTLKHIVAATAAIPVIVALHWHNLRATADEFRFRIGRRSSL